jgi:hypothetical protein
MRRVTGTGDPHYQLGNWLAMLLKPQYLQLRGIYFARECPLQTVSDRGIGHASIHHRSVMII